MSEPIRIAALWPEIVLLIGACTVLLVGQARREARQALTTWAALGTLVVAIVVVLTQRGGDLTTAFGSGLRFDALANFVRVVALGIGVPLVLINWAQSRRDERGEYLSMMLVSLAGLLLVAPADNLLMLFLALELVSIPTYIMVVLSRTNDRGVEAGTKYFYLGAMAAAVMAYGFAFLYGVSGTLSLSGMVAAVTDALREPATLRGALAIIGVVLSLGGLLFKLAAVPLHMYVADVYHGAASPVAGLLGFVPKLAGLMAIFKILTLTSFWISGHEGIYWFLFAVAVASMTVGNVLALQQTNIKRMLAYSGIAHAGYMLVGVIAGPLAGESVVPGGVGIMGNGTAAVLYYVVIYGIANLAAFAVLGLLRTRAGACETLRDAAGLIRREPGLALLLALAMFTLMGLPPLPGFWGKLSLFGSALAASDRYADNRMLYLVIIAVLNSAVAAAYYLRVVAAVLVYDNRNPAYAVSRSAEQIGAQLCGFLLIIFALYPNSLMAQGQTGVSELTIPAAVQTPLERQEPPASNDTVATDAIDSPPRDIAASDLRA
jgi:NADH-quinone oxidoreductase subunit N